MATQRGRDVLIRIEGPVGGFVTIAGIRTTRFSLHSNAPDATTAESPGRWRELLSGAGVRSVSVSGSGVFKDGESDALLRAAFFEDDAVSLELVVPDFGVMSGRFHVLSLDYAGDHDAEAGFEVSLESAGALTFSDV